MNGVKKISCVHCDNKKLSRNEIGLNKKLIHRRIEQMMCMTCMATYFETTEEEMEEMVERFKQQGCELFG